MNRNIVTRILTALFLIILLVLSFFYSYILIITLILLSTISWIEFHGLISRIFHEDVFRIKFFKLLAKVISLLYITFFSFLIFNGITHDYTKLNIFFLITICIFSDTGGFVFGKVFKGKKLTNISPNKTISGSIGSFILSLSCIPIFIYLLPLKINHIYNLIILTILVSTFCQLGDLLISYFKRKAKVKDTGDLLPGHGGILDRIDGIIFAVPLGIFLWDFLIFK